MSSAYYLATLPKDYDYRLIQNSNNKKVFIGLHKNKVPLMITIENDKVTIKKVLI